MLEFLIIIKFWWEILFFKEISFIDWQYNTSSPNNNVTDYIAIDLKQCVWPRYPPYPQQWSYPIPSFNLMDTIIIPIGYNNQTDANFIPFKSWKNENFIMRIFEVTVSIVIYHCFIYSLQTCF